MDQFLFQTSQSFSDFLQTVQPNRINFYTSSISLGGVYELSKLFSEPVPLQVYLTHTQDHPLSTPKSELEVGYQLEQSKKAREGVTWLSHENHHFFQLDSNENTHSNFLSSLVTLEQENKNEYLIGNYELTRSFLDKTVNKKSLEVILHSDNEEASEALNEKMNDISWVDIKSSLRDALRNYSKFRNPNEIYHLILHHLFQKKRTYVFEEDPELETTLVWKKLFNFQRDGAIAILEKLNRYEGCILADSVGLGKTYTALAVIMAYQRMNKNVAVICPRRLEENWKRFKSTDSTNPFRNSNGQPIFNYSLFRHSALRNGTWQRQAGHNLNFSLIVIDESHNFRNENGGRYQFLQEYLTKNKNTRVLMLTATPINNHVKDLKNQFKLLRHIPRGLNYGRQYNDFQEEISNVLDNADSQIQSWQERYQQRNGNVSPLSQWLSPEYFNLLKRYVIARNVDVIRQDYPQFIQEKGNLPNEKPLPVSPDIAKGLSIKEIIAQFEQLTFVAYSQEDFFKNNQTASPLLGMLKIGFLKRFESSVESARKTLEALIKNMETVNERVDRLRQLNGNLQTTKIDDDSIDDYVNNLDDDNYNFQFNNGSAIKTTTQKINDFKNTVKGDIIKLKNLKRQLNQIGVNEDLKLRDLKDRIQEKMKTPVKKVLIFTAYKDTADYLYENIRYMNNAYTVACVTGEGVKVSTYIPDCFNQAGVLRHFAPIGQDQPPSDTPINILIATDCISEGQNLQDCDMVINYDIHWNPVRLIQRNGRINRIGSPHTNITIVNYWPMPKIDDYLDVYTRVMTRSAIGGTITHENLNNTEVNRSIFFQNQQLKEMQETNPALKVLARAQEIRIHDIRPFESEYQNWIKNKNDKSQKELFEVVKKAPLGVHAISRNQNCANQDTKICFLLRKKKINKNVDANENYRFVVLNANPNGLVYEQMSDAQTLSYCQHTCVNNVDIDKKQEELLENIDSKLFEEALRRALKEENQHLNLDDYTLATYLVVGDVNDLKQSFNTSSNIPLTTTPSVIPVSENTVQTELPLNTLQQNNPSSIRSSTEEQTVTSTPETLIHTEVSFEDKLIKDATHGDKQTQYQLGFRYYEGKGVTKSITKAIKWLEKSAEQGYAPAQSFLGWCYHSSDESVQNIEKARYWYHEAAKQGDCDAQYNLGEFYLEDKYVPKNLNEAKKWFEKAAKQGDREAQYKLAQCYDETGTIEGEEIALQWYQKAALNGHIESMHELAECYYYGKRPQEAIKWYLMAARKGYANAQYALAQCYENGEGTFKDMNKAFEWYKKAAMEGGHRESMYELAECYYYGRGIKQSPQEAVKWYCNAAELNHIDAQYELAQCYEYGDGTSKDIKMALKWYRKAAEGGHEQAKKDLLKLSANTLYQAVGLHTW